MDSVKIVEEMKSMERRRAGRKGRRAVAVDVKESYVIEGKESSLLIPSHLETRFCMKEVASSVPKGITGPCGYICGLNGIKQRIHQKDSSHAKFG